MDTHTRQLMASLMNEQPKYPIKKKFIIGVKLDKLFEDSEHPTRIQCIVADGSSILIKEDTLEPSRYILEDEGKGIIMAIVRNLLATCGIIS